MLICLIYNILNNTFIGTLIAGIIIAIFGLFLYRKQKDTDIKYEDIRRVRELSSSLLTNIEIAFKKYENQLSIYTDKSGAIYIFKTIKSQLGALGQSFDEETAKDFKEMSNKITNDTDKLIAHLKIEGNNDSDIKIITENTITFNFYIGTISVLHMFKSEDLEEHRNNVSKTLEQLREVLQKIIRQK